MTNEQFNKLSVEKQSRAVAWDTIQQVKLNKNMNISHHAYITPPDILYDIHQIIKGDHAECNVCAKGAAALSYIRCSGNAVKTSHLIKRGINELFGSSWHIIEAIYESNDACDYFNLSAIIDSKVTCHQIDLFLEFCNKLPGDRDDNTVIQLMRNYLANDEIDLGNHPDPDEEIAYDDKTGTVIVCDKLERLTF